MLADVNSLSLVLIVKKFFVKNVDAIEVFLTIQTKNSLFTFIFIFSVIRKTFKT